MCKKKKTVFRIKGLILQSDLNKVMGLIPNAAQLLYQATFKDQKEEALIKKGKKSRSVDFNRYGHIEIRDHNEEHLRKIYQALSPYLVRDYTSDFA